MSPKALVPYRGPAISNAVGGRANLIKSEITMSLALLKEASSLVSKVPFISPLAGLLLYLIQVYDEVQQGKKEWALVVQRLLDIASLVIRAGRSCERLGKEDLAHLQVDLQHLQRDLERIAEALKECAVSSRIKKVFMRTDILLKINQCDGMLTHAHSMFQTKMSLHIHFTQLTQSREVHIVHVAPVTPSVKVASSESSMTTTTESSMITTKVFVYCGIISGIVFFAWKAFFCNSKRK